MNEPLPNLLRRAAHILDAGRRVAMCLLVNNRGSTPQSAGALMLVDDAANLYGTVGGGCVEAEVRRRAHAMLVAGQSGLMRFKLDHDYGWDDGLICGGTIEIAVAPPPPASRLRTVADCVDAREHTSLQLGVELEDGPARYVYDLPPRPRLLIAGAGHVGAALARQARRLDFDVTLYDDRADLLARNAPDGCATVDGDFADNLRAAEVDLETYCVIVTRGHRHDEQALEAVVGRGARYVGMIGSRRKVKLIFDDLRERGVPNAALAPVRAPIGLDIGSVLVEEIALSIAAELVKVRRSERAKPISGPLPVEQPKGAHA